MKQLFLLKMIEFGLLPSSGEILDLGCGAGRDALFLAEKGYKVTAVDVKSQSFTHPNITFIQSDIAAFPIEKNRYSAIIARNVLPFIQEKATVKKILTAMTEGLTSSGSMYFTVFGEKDAWSSRKTMSFFNEKEIGEIVEKLPINVFEKTAMEGFGSTMSGEIKFWNTFSFTCTKKPLPAVQ